MISRQAGAGENYDIRPNQVLTYTSYSVFNVHISILLGVLWMIFRLILSIIFFSVSAGFAAENYRLTILHTNDFHARFERISKYDSACGVTDNAEGKCFGGSARLVTAIELARQRNPNSILVDGGDQFQGTLFYTYYKGRLAAEMMNKLGYDAMTVGNHEFDDGPEVLSGFIDAVTFPVLMSNADISAEPRLLGKLAKSAVIERGGEKLGLIGLTPVDTRDLASPGDNISFTDPVAAVQREVDELTAKGVNKIIVLSHSGYGVDQRVAADTTGVDVIVGGHSNTFLSNISDRAEGPYPTMVGNTAIVSAYAYGKLLGELTVLFDEAGGVVSAAGEPLIMDAGVDEDAQTVRRIAKASAPLEAIRQKIVAHVGAEMIVGGCRARECEMGVLIADAMLESVKSQGVQIAIQNGGGIRASLDTGEVTMGEILTILPFQNTLSTFRVSGATLLAALENGVSQVEEGAGRFPQVAGLTYAFDPAGTVGKRVSDVRVLHSGRAVPLDPVKLYSVVSTNYLRNGGDGYKMFKAAQDVYDFGPDLADIVAEYMAAHAPYQPYLAGRIIEK